MELHENPFLILFQTLEMFIPMSHIGPIIYRKTHMCVHVHVCIGVSFRRSIDSHSGWRVESRIEAHVSEESEQQKAI